MHKICGGLVPSGLVREYICPALLPIRPVNETPQVNHRLQRPEDPNRPRSPQACPINRGYPTHRLIRRSAEPPIIRRSEIGKESLLVYETEFEAARLADKVFGPHGAPFHTRAPDVHAHVRAATCDQCAVVRNADGKHPL